MDLHDKYICFQLVQRNHTHVHAAWNYAAKKKDPYRVTQVVPVAGNLPLADNHTREHHPGLNATVKLGRKHNGASDRMCTLLAPFVIYHSHFVADLMLTLRGGMYVGRNQSAVLYYHCNASAQEVSPLLHNLSTINRFLANKSGIRMAVQWLPCLALAHPSCLSALACCDTQPCARAIPQ